MPSVIPVSIKNGSPEQLNYIRSVISEKKKNREWGWMSLLARTSDVNRATLYSLVRNDARPQARTIRDVYYAIIELEKNQASA